MSANYLFFLPRNDFAMFFFAHESHESTRNIFNELKGDLYGRTNLTNTISELVKIRATEQVAIIMQSNIFV